MFSVNLKSEMTPTQTILLNRHLNHNGEAQRFFTNEIKRLSDPYTPLDSSVLKNSTIVDTNTITYNQVYSNYQWVGVSKLGKHLNYQGAPKRGKEWTFRMWADRGDEIVKSVATFIGGVAK